MQLRCIAERRAAPLTRSLNAPSSGVGADQRTRDRDLKLVETSRVSLCGGARLIDGEAAAHRSGQHPPPAVLAGKLSSTRISFDAF